MRNPGRSTQCHRVVNKSVEFLMAKQMNPGILYYVKVLRFTALLMFAYSTHIKSLLKGAFYIV